MSEKVRPNPPIDLRLANGPVNKNNYPVGNCNRVDCVRTEICQFAQDTERTIANLRSKKLTPIPDLGKGAYQEVLSLWEKTKRDRVVRRSEGCDINKVNLVGNSMRPF